MAKRSEFVELVSDLLAFVNGLRVRAMFSGHGVYQNDRMFAILMRERLYFKTDTVTRADFQARELEPFSYEMRGKTVSTGYYEAPPEVFDEPDAMRHWATLALAAAARAKAPKAPRRSPRRAEQEPPDSGQ